MIFKEKMSFINKILYFCQDILYWSKEAIYWTKCHLVKKHKHHLIDIRSRDYKYGWIDQDGKMLLACFKCLEDFVENEEGMEILEYQTKEQNFTEALNQDGVERERARQEEAKRIFNEVKELYDWWKIGWEKETEEINNLLKDVDMSIKFIECEDSPEYYQIDSSAYKDNPKWNEYRERVDKLNLKDDEMLLRLIKIRHYLWT